MIVLDLPQAVVASVEAMAGRAGMTASCWLAEQVSHAFGTGRVIETAEPRRRPSRRRANHATTETTTHA